MAASRPPRPPAAAIRPPATPKPTVRTTSPRQAKTDEAPDPAELRRESLQGPIPAARALAVEQNALVRVVPDPSRYVTQLRLLGSTLVTSELILVATNADRRHLIEAGFHARLLIAANP
ncbi:hypothetical protein [Saccharopolyspora spinosa]|uniref:Uncharacterized protein n=1 Tax=Saccharopolyspora spinosa TaxID=60894 RepID=A0A2N3XWC8_SACSN|nr:hypothetical protein [Saccharopolyspora spinosa]PKW14983.1 hypothetical protein A8926_2643 [Saccharopolyspora spinosa]